MRDPSPGERLLADVLTEGASPDFRERLLHETLCLARRRRRFRQVRAAASALAVLVVLGLLFRHQFLSVHSPAGLAVKPHGIIRTQPLSLTAVVTTRPLPPGRLVASVSARNILVTAAARPPLREINDDELLALAPAPAVLVRRGPHLAELVFVSLPPADEPLQN